MNVVTRRLAFSAGAAIAATLFTVPAAASAAPAACKIVNRVEFSPQHNLVYASREIVCTGLPGGPLDVVLEQKIPGTETWIAVASAGSDTETGGVAVHPCNGTATRQYRNKFDKPKVISAPCA